MTVIGVADVEGQPLGVHVETNATVVGCAGRYTTRRSEAPVFYRPHEGGAGSERGRRPGCCSRSGWTLDPTVCDRGGWEPILGPISYRRYEPQPVSTGSSHTSRRFSRSVPGVR